SDESRALIAESRSEFDQARKALADYQELVRQVPDTDGLHAQVIKDTTALLEQGIGPLFGLLEAGQTAEFHQALGGTVQALLVTQNRSLNTLNSSQQQALNAIYERETSHYQLVT